MLKFTWPTSVLVIEYFGKTIPTLEEPAAHLDKRQKRARRDALRHTYFKVLKDCVGPWNAERVYEAKVLNNGMYSSHFWRFWWADYFVGS